jgi:hypothetical protein
MEQTLNNGFTITATDSLLGIRDGGPTGTLRARVDGSGNVVIGNAALATTATDGFLYVPTMAGTPTGTPTSYSGMVPLVFDTTNNKLYVYSGPWKSVTLS